MASSKVMTRKSDLTLRASSPFSSSSSPANKTDQNQSQSKISQNSNNNKFTSPMTLDGFLNHNHNNVYHSNPSSDQSTLLDAQITLIEPNLAAAPRTTDDVWREIEARKKTKKDDDVMMKEELLEEEEDSPGLMTLEDFLAKAGSVEDDQDDVKVQQPPFVPVWLSGGFDPVVLPPPGQFSAIDMFGNGVVEMIGGGGSGSGGGRVKRGRRMMEPLDKVAQQRQQRMINNRASAARSRERKQAYQEELESQAMRLKEENEQLMKEKEERTKERFKQLMEKVVPVVEKRRPLRPLRRVSSAQW